MCVSRSGYNAVPFTQGNSGLDDWVAAARLLRLRESTGHNMSRFADMRFKERVMNVQSTVAVLILSISVLHSQHASASWGELKQPRLPMARTFTEVEYAKLNAVLDRKDVTFIKGYALNFHSALLYSGDTLSLNLFIEALTECPKVSVHICFFRPSPCANESDWMVTHTANSNELVVRINLDSPRIDLTKLHIPTIVPKKT
jgi:hypothetical protein